MPVDRISEIQGMFDRGEVSAKSIMDFLKTLPKPNPNLGKLLVRLPVELHSKLKEEAKLLGISLNQHCMNKLEARTNLRRK